MFKRFDPRIIFGVLLIAGGVLALLQTMGYLKDASDMFWGGVFVVAGLAFLALLTGGHWWSAYPGFTLLAIGTLILLPDRYEDLGGMIFLGGIALSFWVTYLTSPRERWWALIPAGVLTTLAGMTLAAQRLGGFETGGLFFLGLAITFLLVAALAGMKWAYWPAGVLGLLGIFATLSMLDAMPYLWAAALIAAGVFVIFRSFRRSDS